MKKLNKQALLDLERETKSLRLLNKDKTREFTKALVSLKKHLEQLSSALEGELEKYSYCENCKNYHEGNDSQKFEVEIREDDPGYGYYYDICPYCGHRDFIERKLLEKRK